MYPKVFTDFAARAGHLRPGQRAADAGLFLRHEAGRRDLRRDRAGQDAGHPLPGRSARPTRRARSASSSSSTASRARVKVPDRAHGAPRPRRGARPRPATTTHVGAPMPGVVSTLAVKAGQAVKAGDVLLSIEAMKMETALHAERDGTIAEVLVKRRRPDRRQGSAGRVRVDAAFLPRSRGTTGASLVQHCLSTSG